MKYDEIDDALDITPTEVKSEKIVKKEPEVTEVVTSTQEQLKKDYEYTRGNLYSLIEKGQEAVDGILELAQESDSPRAFEVAGQLIKHVGDVADKLVDLQKKVKDIEKDDGKSSKATNVTNNAVFFGSTADLQKFLKNNGDSK
jgi:uncharacterized protein YaaN involved in tellurite resistance|tara:strand:+ start:4560 stop:4988 length:429 start_codon:yes stop_codon:yes gene_type:complete